MGVTKTKHNKFHAKNILANTDGWVCAYPDRHLLKLKDCFSPLLPLDTVAESSIYRKLVSKWYSARAQTFCKWSEM
jgi:hypothetical protein